jgi:hypothetical protein
MKKIILPFLNLLSGLCVFGQQKESFDITSYIVPAGWKKESKQDVVIYSKADATTGGYCIIALYAAETSSGDAETDFEQEWQELAVKGYNTETRPATESQTTADGWKVIAAAAAGKKDGIDSYIVITVFSGFGKRTSVFANLNDQSYVVALDEFLGSIQLDKTVAQSKPPVSNSVSTNPSLTGKWARSSSGPPQYNNGRLVNLAGSGYHKGQYDFQSDGSYSFHGESQFSSTDFAITVEKGKYIVSGNTLTLIPENSSVKKVDLNGNFKKMEQLSLAKRTYTWQSHYFEGIQETQLVLSNVKENIIDGGYGSSSQFPASFLYSREYKPEWRFVTQ